MRCLETWKIYWRLVYESPVAKKRRVMASRIFTGIAALIRVSSFVISGQIKLINNSKSLGVIRVKFLKWTSSKCCKILTRFL